jgi:hypothetical protein
MRETIVQRGDSTSTTLLEGVAATLRRLEREVVEQPDVSAHASRRLATFQRSLAKALQAAHLESVQELRVG